MGLYDQRIKNRPTSAAVVWGAAEHGADELIPLLH